MKEKMLSFLAKRLESKIAYLRNNDLNEDALELLLDDIEHYADEIISVAKEVILPWNLGI